MLSSVPCKSAGFDAFRWHSGERWSQRDGGLGKTVHATGISPIPENQRVAQFWNIAAFDANHPSLREAFNATHHPNWNAPSIDARNSATLSKVVSAGRCGKMQLGLKYILRT
jgi:hypothetical protein